MRKKSKKVLLENLGTHSLSEIDCGSITDGVDIEGAEIIKLSDIDKSLPIDDQISPENVGVKELVF